MILAAERKRHWSRRKIKQIAINRGVSQWQLKGGRVMQVDISPGYRRIRIATKDAQERIKRILDWHADAGGAKSYGSSRSLKWIRRKRNSGQRCIEKRSRNFEIGKYGQVFVAQVAGERAVERLAIRRRKRWRESREVKEQVVPIPRRSVYNAGYRKWIGIKWRRRDVRSRMRCRSVRAEKQTRNQTLAMHSAREIPAANVESSKWNKIAVTGNVAVTAEQATRALIEIGDHHDVGFVITRAGFQPRFPFTHIVGTAEVCVAVRATDFQATEFVDQEEVNHTGHGICSVHRRSAIIQHIDVIDHGERNQLDVVATEY